MNKKELTEAGIKVVAVYMILRVVVGVVSSLVALAIVADRSPRGLLLASLGGLTQVVISVIVIRKTDWIVNKLYRE